MGIAYSQVQAASTWLSNTTEAGHAAEETGLPFWLMCAVLEKESRGKNVYGHDAGGALSGYPRPVDESNWRVYWWLVSEKKQTANGYGPMQITHPDLTREMLAQNLKPWDAQDNMLYGASVLRRYLTEAPRKTMSTEQRIKEVGRRYNGSPAYGADLWRVAKIWHSRVGSTDNRSFTP